MNHKKFGNSFISINGLCKSFHDQAVLRGIQLEIQKGELFVLIGRSGCGKSTLLRCMNGLESFDEGRIQIGEIELTPSGATVQALRQNVGMVFQSFNLFPHLSVLENLTIAPRVVKKQDPAHAREIAWQLLEKVGLTSHAQYYPSQLSGGQQQRAAIARALAMKPQVLLYDEPTSALDPSLTEEVLAVMRTLNEEGMTQILVTHEMHFAKNAADRIAYLEDGQVIEVTVPDKIFSEPEDPRTRKFLERFIHA